MKMVMKYTMTLLLVFSPIDIGYSQFAISIEWEMTDEVMHNLGLYGMYNTNFQKFIFDNYELEIHNDNGTVVYISVKEEK